MNSIDAVHHPQLADAPSSGFKLPDFELSGFELPESDMIERIREGLRAHAAGNVARQIGRAHV